MEKKKITAGSKNGGVFIVVRVLCNFRDPQSGGGNKKEKKKREEEKIDEHVDHSNLTGLRLEIRSSNQHDQLMNWFKGIR